MATLPDPVYCATVDNNYADCADAGKPTAIRIRT
jgi:hypothetical protein